MAGQWQWTPLFDGITKNTPKGSRLPDQPYRTNWLKLGVYCCLFDREFIRDVFLNLPDEVLPDKVPMEVRDAFSSLYLSKQPVNMLTVTDYLRTNYPDTNHTAAMYVVTLLDKRDEFWFNLETAKRYFAMCLIKTLRKRH